MVAVLYFQTWKRSQVIQHLLKTQYSKSERYQSEHLPLQKNGNKPTQSIDKRYFMPRHQSRISHLSNGQHLTPSNS